MRKTSKFEIKKYRLYVIVALLSSGLFCLIYGTLVLNPTYVGWLYSDGWSDPTIHYLGWKAFRNNPWMFPIGLMNNLAYPVHTSIIFTDSLPLVAVLLKIVSPILPADFQYFGIYQLFGFMATSILTVKILKEYSNNKTAIVLSTTFFLISQMLLNRACVHVALSSQWLLLLALEPIFLKDLFYECRPFYKRCFLLGILASSIHLYYVPMCGICLLGYSVADWIETKRWKKQVISLFLYCLTCFLIIWLLGGFQGGFSMPGAEYLGRTSFNLISLFNPYGGWSFLLREHGVIDPYQADGYLGGGVLLLSFSTCVLILKIGLKDTTAVIRRHKVLALGILVSSALAFLVALSPVISFGSHTIYKIPLPNFILNAWAVFRSTNRFIWIVEYNIILLCCCAVCTKLGKKEAIILLLFCVVTQAVDLKNKIQEIHIRYSDKVQKSTLLKDSDFWESIETDDRIKEVVFTTSLSGNQLYNITDWSINNNFKQNFFLFGRSLGDIVWKNAKNALAHPSEAQIFIFIEANKEDCCNYELTYYEVDGFIVGHKGELNTSHPKAILE